MVRPAEQNLTTEAAAPERAGPALALGALGRFLVERGLADGGPLDAHEIGSGHSNPTYLVTGGDTELVVRRPPAGPLPPTAHDVLREVRVLKALHGRLPVPRVLAVCADTSVIGAPFFVMEKVEGVVLTDSVPEPLAAAGDRTAIADRLVGALADLHAVDPRACGLGDLGRPDGYLTRQLRRLRELWETNRTRDVAKLDRVADWLRARMPTSGPASIVHGDYRLGNAMFARHAPARLVAVFDWEMATLGDPLADIGYLAAFWVQPDDPPLRMFELSEATRSGGFPSRAEIVAAYEERSGRRVAEPHWYEALALYKLAVVMEGNYARARAGVIANPYLADFENGVIELADRAAEVAFAAGVR